MAGEQQDGRYRSHKREVINRNTFVSLALAAGYNAFLPVYDGGIDMILHREADGTIRKVQLKSRWTIDRKYLGRDIWIAFPIAGEWHLVAHDAMVEQAGRDGALSTASWLGKGIYSRATPSRATAAACAPYRFGTVQDVAEAGEEADPDPDAVTMLKAAAEPSPAPAAGTLTPHERIAGSMLGGAIGDAVGAAVEFLSMAEIRKRFGPDGVRGLKPAFGRTGAITDDTQMTMFTAEGLIRAAVRARSKGMCHIPSVVHHAYLRWLLTQGGRPEMPVEPDGWLFGVRALHHRRAPGGKCLSALEAATGFGDPAVASNNSKGCGGVMRAAPVGLVGAAAVGSEPEIFSLGAQTAALTHGHPSGWLSAGYLAAAVAALMRGDGLDDAFDAAGAELRRHDGAGEVVRAVEAARELAAARRPTPEDIQALGGGWTGEEALSIAVCCTLSAVDFEDGVLLASNHGGDSDSTASITGNLLGALMGVGALPERLLGELEMRTEIERLSADLALIAEGCEAEWDDYPGW